MSERLTDDQIKKLNEQRVAGVTREKAELYDEQLSAARERGFYLFLKRHCGAIAVANNDDVVILDLSMPVMNGYEAVAEIRKIAPAIKIVIFSMHDIPSTARQVGADAFVSKSHSATELLTAIEQVTNPH